MIELEKIEKIYNAGKATETHALKDINLRIEEGDMVAITGPSGSGKSTLLHIIAGIDSPSSGEYRFCGKLVSDMSDKERCRIRNQKIGMIMQDFGLLENKAKKILSAVGLSGLEQKKTNQLSGGQRQRVAIARALAMDAKVIIADEPTGALDSENTDSLMDLLLELNRQGITIIIVSHDPKVAMRCPIRYRIEDGRIGR